MFRNLESADLKDLRRFAIFFSTAVMCLKLVNWDSLFGYDFLCIQPNRTEKRSPWNECLVMGSSSIYPYYIATRITVHVEA